MPELRQDPTTKEWVVISTERARRPEDFFVRPAEEEKPEAKKACPFCPGNERLTPEEILAYRAYDTKPGQPGWWLRVIPNKFPALVPSNDITRYMEEGLFRHMAGVGEHEVIIESPSHDLTIATMEQKQVEEIFLAYRERYIKLCQDPRFELVILFKNHGREAGTSLRHPHSQLIATPITPSHIRHKLDEAMRYFDDEGRCVFCVLLEKELKNKIRIVLETDNFLSFEPFASKSPFETLILPKKHCSAFGYITHEESKELAYIVRLTLAKIYKALKNPDYNYVIHSTPCHDMNEEYYHWHLQIVPRVVAVAGFELGSGIYINTVVPEEAAKFLRETAV